MTAFKITKRNHLVTSLSSHKKKKITIRKTGPKNGISKCDHCKGKGFLEDPKAYDPLLPVEAYKVAGDLRGLLNKNIALNSPEGLRLIASYLEEYFKDQLLDRAFLASGLSHP